MELISNNKGRDLLLKIDATKANIAALEKSLEYLYQILIEVIPIEAESPLYVTLEHPEKGDLVYCLDFELPEFPGDESYCDVDLIAPVPVKL